MEYLRVKDVRGDRINMSNDDTSVTNSNQMVRYGRVISHTTEQTIELGEINGVCEINIQIPINWEMQKYLDQITERRIG